MIVSALTGMAGSAWALRAFARQGGGVLSALCCLLAMLCLVPQAWAHNLSYATMRAQISGAGDYTIELHLHLAALIMGEPQGHLSEEARSRFERLGEDELAALSARTADALRGAVAVFADGRSLGSQEIRLPDLATLRADGLVPASSPQPSAPVVISGRLPAGTRTFSVAAPPDLPEVLFSVEAAEGVVIAQVLRDGERSHPFTLGSDGMRTLSITLPAMVFTIAEYGALGFSHILPKGADHILFVLALFLLAPRWGALAWQVTAFTIAHSVTLALAVLGVLEVSPAIVEPMIAISILAVAVDNMFSDRLRTWRTSAVFACGLLHGLGFAGVLSATGLPKGEEAAALVSFNVGVEIGQIAVLALAFLAVGWFRDRRWFRERVSLPASAAIAGFGAFWTIERLAAHLL